MIKYFRSKNLTLCNDPADCGVLSCSVFSLHLNVAQGQNRRQSGDWGWNIGCMGTGSDPI